MMARLSWCCRLAHWRGLLPLFRIKKLWSALPAGELGAAATMFLMVRSDHPLTAHTQDAQYRPMHLVYGPMLHRSAN